MAGAALSPVEEAVLEALVDLGVATGVEGLYCTPLMPAATSKTDPPPYS
jgi:hypothetical protein